MGPQPNRGLAGPLPGGEGALSFGESPLSSSLAGPAGTRELTPMQQKVKNAGAIGAVVHFDAQWAFVVVGVGSERGIKVGDSFAVRRDHFVIARVEISEVKEGQSIANLVPDSLEPGMVIQSGDEIIHNPLP